MTDHVHHWMPITEFVEVNSFDSFEGPIRREETRVLSELCIDCHTTRPVPTE